MYFPLVLVLLLHLLLHLSEECEDDIKTVSALGRMASIGDLYDLRTDQFTGLSVLKTEFPKSTIDHLINSYSSIKLSHDDSLIEKLDNLGVSVSVTVELAGGVLEVKGTIGYDKNEGSSHELGHSYLYYKIRTQKDVLNIHHNDIQKKKDIFEEVAFESKVATHMVIGILWGANCVVECSYKRDTSLEKSNITAKLEVTVPMLGDMVKGSATLAIGEDDQKRFEAIGTAIYGDILPREGTLPTNFADTLDFLKHVPSLVHASNGGKGVPIEYVLHPISKLRDLFLGSAAEAALIKNLQKSIIKQVLKLYEEVTQVKLVLQQFNSFVKTNRRFVRKVDRQEVSDYLDTMEKNEVTLRGDLTTYLVNVKKGTAKGEDVLKLIKTFNASDASPKRVLDQIDDWWWPIHYKINVGLELEGNGSIYLGAESSVDEELVVSDKSVVLFYNQSAFLDDEERWIHNKLLFIDEIKARQKAELEGIKTKFFAVDCDIQNCTRNLDRSSLLRIYRSNFISVRDVYEKRGGENDCGIRLGRYLKKWENELEQVSLIEHYFNTNETTLDPVEPPKTNETINMTTEDPTDT